jgi:chemotaxis protein MotB
MIPPRKQQQEDNVDSWLMSYADMITLLMCFFIIFVSVSEPKKDKFSMITDGLANKFGSVDLSTPFVGLMRSWQGVAENYQMLQDIAIEKTERTLAMELASQTFFTDGTAEIAPEAKPALDEMIKAILEVKTMEFRVVISSYTSNLAAPPAFASNWEYSAARAARLVRYFIEKGVNPSQMKAVAMGETEPKVPNMDAAGKSIPENQRRNERVVVSFERVL